MQHFYFVCSNGWVFMIKHLLSTGIILRTFFADFALLIASLRSFKRFGFRYSKKHWIILLQINRRHVSSNSKMYQLDNRLLFCQFKHLNLQLSYWYILFVAWSIWLIDLRTIALISEVCPYKIFCSVQNVWSKNKRIIYTRKIK